MPEEELDATVIPTNGSLESTWEEEATRLCGPTQRRKIKNERYVTRLVRRHSESLIREILVTLSRLDRPYCARQLSEIDLATTPLHEIIQPYDIMGLELRVRGGDRQEFQVEISMAYGHAGDGGRFILERVGNGFVIKEPPVLWIC